VLLLEESLWLFNVLAAVKAAKLPSLRKTGASYLGCSMFVRIA
jgi:hypothetical protein